VAVAVIDIRVKGGSELSRVRKQVKDINNLVRGIRPVPALFDKRTFQGLDALFGKNRRVLDAANKLSNELEGIAKAEIKIQGTTASLNRQLGNLQGVFDNLKRGGKEWKNTLVSIERAQVAVAQAEQKAMVQRQKALSNASQARGRDIVGKTLALSIDKEDIANSIDGLTAYRSELLRLFTSVEIGSKHYLQLEEAIKKVDKQLEKPKRATVRTPNITRGIGGLAGREQALKEALRIQNQLETGSDAHIKSIVGVRKAQQAYNQELRVSKTIQSALNLDLIVWKKLLDSVPAIVGKIAGGMKGLFMGKFGKLGQAAGVIGVSSAIEQLIQKIPFLDQGLKNNIQSWARWTQRAVEGITGITVAWTALNGLLGGAQWVVGAVAGFAQFESAASKAIWTIEGQMTRAFSTFGRFARELPSMASALAMIMPESLGGMGVKGSFFDYLGDDKGGRDKLKETMLGGEERIEDKRYRKAGGQTDLQKKQADLNQVNKALSQRNTTEKDYIQLLQRKFKLESDVSREKRKQQVMEVKAGKPFEEVFKKEIDAYNSRVKKKLDAEKRAEREIRSERAKRAKANKQQLIDELKEIKTAEAAEMKKIKNVMAADAKAHKKALDMENQRRKARKDRMGRLGENLMLGAGFPMLFGGGAGAVAGGTVGALAQSAMGSQGFGAQILLSALGQQFDAFAKKTSELGQAFTALDKDTTPLIEGLGKTGTEFEKQIQALEKLGESEKAFALARDEMVRLVGADGVESLTEYGENTRELSSIWSQFMTQMGAGLAELINSSGMLKSIIESLSSAVTLMRGRGMIETNPEIAEVFQEMEDKRLEQGKYRPWERGTGGRKDQGESRVNYEIRVSRQKTFGQLNEEVKLLVKKADLLKAEESGLALTNALKAAGTKSLEEEIAHLERSLKIGSKAVEQEKEAADIYKQQKDALGKKLELNEEDFLKLVKKRDQLKEQLELWKQIKDTIAGGLTNAITGLIEGTKTLGEALGSIVKQIGQIFLNKALTSWIGGMNFGGPSVGTQVGSMIGTFGEGGHVANGIKSFSTGGLVTRPTIGLVGEAGEDEYIIPSSKMQGAMERYSAGARGQGVIPGSGTVASGSGVSSTPTVVNYTGPVLSFDSEAYVPKSAIPEIINSAARRGAQEGESKVFSKLKNSRSQRSRVGL
jgi:hypothetical protein